MAAGRQAREGRRSLCGTLNFYNAVPLEGGGGSNPGIFPSYDVTALLKNLAEQKAMGDQVSVTIIPSGNPAANAKASIGRIDTSLASETAFFPQTVKSWDGAAIRRYRTAS